MIINNRFHRIVIHLLSAILLSIVVTSSLMLNGCSPRKTLPTISTDDNNITKDTTTIKDANTSSEETKSNVTVRLNMKSYGDHDTEYDARIIRICPEYVIDNPPHGLYGEMEGYNDPFLLQNISGYQAVGIKVIGYISSGYEGAGGDDKYDLHWYSLEINEKLIRNMANEDHIDGVSLMSAASTRTRNRKNI